MDRPLQSGALSEKRKDLSGWKMVFSYMEKPANDNSLHSMKFQGMNLWSSLKYNQKRSNSLGIKMLHLSNIGI